MQVRQIHQFSFACNSGDGVTNSMFYIRQLLRQLGFQSEIYCETTPQELKGEILDISAFQDNQDTLLFAHHCMGYDHWQWLIDVKAPKIMVYHNITPTDLLPEGDIRRWADLGREQLRDWTPYFKGAIGVSQLNSLDLQKHHYANIATIPMLVDFEKIKKIKANVEGSSQFRDTYNLLFIGRICENKKQLDLIEVVHHLRHKSTTPIRLILAGAVSSGVYKEQIDQRIVELGLEKYIHFAGKVTDEQLAGLYRNADAFVCMSAHEGFGMPLIEAMHYSLPVIARDSSNIADTMGEGGLLIEAGSTAWDCANAVWTLMCEPALKRDIIQRQHKNLERYSQDVVQQQLAQYLQQLEIELPHVVKIDAVDTLNNVSKNERNLAWHIEGPFDSNYSLAIVNRELAKALEQQNVNVALRSHEGYGDFSPSQEFLISNPECHHLFEKFEATNLPPLAALRFCFPPHLDDMPATARVIHSYGWEETGFPLAYADEFNRRLDMVTVLSELVGKTLRDHGVRVPIVVTGAGVDHVLQTPAEVLPLEMTRTWKTFRFLHISSCFPRKGVDVLLRAYAKVFRASDDVSLIIKTFSNVHNEVSNDLKKLRQQDNHFPHVEIIFDELSQGEIVALYQSSQAFVAPSRGEGLGLPMAEAMLFDLPVITTEWGGQSDFCDQTSAWCCDYSFVKSDSHLGLTHSLWAEPDIHDLARLLKQVHSLTPQEKQKKTKVAKNRISTFYTWQQTATKTKQAMEALFNQTQLRNEPKIAWVSSWNARCGIANYSHYLTEMFPENRLTILANHVQERMDFDRHNVVRCWSVGDNETLEDVYETILEQQINAVVIQYNFGFYTLNTLAQLIQKLKNVGIAIYLFLHSTEDVVLPEQIKTLESIQSSLTLVDRIFVHGVEDINRLKKWNIINNVTYFPHGVASQTKSLVPHQVQLEKKSKVIASYGFLLPHKGILELIEAFSMLSEQEDYSLLLLNSLYPVSVSKDLERQCQELIARLGLQHRVKLITEFLSETQTHQLLSSADLIVFPYQETQESSSAAVRVGLATGKPVAVTPLTIFSDVDGAVFYLPGTSSNELAMGIQSLLINHHNLMSKQNQMQAWFEERRWSNLSMRLLNIIDGIANNNF